MQSEYNKLRQDGAIAIRDSKLQPQLHHTQNIKDLGTQISNTVRNNLCSIIMDAIMALNCNTDVPRESPSEPQVSSVNSKPNEMQQLCKLVTDLHQEIKQLKANNSKPVNTVDFNPKTGKPWCRYYHIHGSCNHWGHNRKNKAPRHKDEDTF